MRSYPVFIILILLVAMSTACSASASNAPRPSPNMQDANSGAVSGASSEMSMQAASDSVSESGGASENLEGIGSATGSENLGLVPATRSVEDEMIPDDWPDSVPIMEGFKVNIGGRNHSILTIVAYGDSTVDEVKDFYLNLPGWELQGAPEIVSLDEGDGDTIEEEIFIFNMGSEKLMFKVFESEGQTVLNLMYEDQTPQ